MIEALKNWVSGRGERKDKAKSLRLLITGSAGVVGRAVCRAAVQRGHFVRAFDRLETPLDLGVHETCCGDITDRQALREAISTMDAVLHLAANPELHADFLSELLQPNIVGMYHVCEEAREQKISRLVLTSSLEVIKGLPWRRRMVHIEDGVEPANHYGLTKVYAEEMGRMYAREYGMSVVALRLGWMPRTGTSLEHMKKNVHGKSIYLSASDAGRAYMCAAEASREQVGGFARVFISSRNTTGAGMDPEPAERWIGYVAEDEFLENLPDHL